MSDSTPASWMDTTPIPALVRKSSIPLMISTLVSSLYNLVDSMYVARISEKALTATTVAFPLSMLLFSLSIGTATGVSSRLSRFLGEGDIKNARETGWTGIVLAVLSSIPFLLLGLFGMPALFRLFTTDAEISRLGQAYSRIILLLCLGQLLASLGSRLLQSTGHASLSMTTQILGAVMNCVLDPILIFGWLGCPALGIRGAALATVLSQSASGALSLALYFIKNPALRIGRGQIRIRFDLVGEIYRVGIPVTLTMALSSLMMIAVNRILEGISTTAIAFYGIFSKLQTFLLMPTNGLSQGIIPVTGYFFGGKQWEKVRAVTAYTLKLGLAFSCAGTLVFLLFPGALMSVYNAGQSLRETGETGLRVLALTFVPQAVVMIISNVFSAMGNGMLNVQCSLLKGILPIPLLLVLAHLVGEHWCWFAFVIADFLAAALALYNYRLHSQKVLSAPG